MWSVCPAFVIRNQLMNWKPDLFAIYYDDPELIEPEICTSDYCIVVKKTIETPLNFGTQIIKGGKYAVFRYRGPYEQLWELYYSIYRNWVLFTDMKLRHSPPIERYVNYSINTKPENLLTDIYIPIE
jgi:AraC family transcriptional regulator